VPQRCANILRRDQTNKESSVNKSKACSKCKQIKSLEFFSKHSYSKSGYKSECKNCQAISRKIYNDKNKDKQLKYSQFSEERKVRKRKYNNAWNKENKDKRTLYMSKRRASLKGNGVYKVTDLEIKKLQESSCFYCGLSGGEVDHVIPLSRGGTHSIGNLVGACRSCNSSKNNNLIMEWVIKKRGLPQPTTTAPSA